MPNSYIIEEYDEICHAERKQCTMSNSTHLISGSGIELLPMSQLKPYPQHPFRLYSDNKLSELASSIEKAGLQQPIIVRAHDGGYEILSGHNRVNACKMLGWDHITAIITKEDDAAAMNVVICTNLQQREKLLHSEKARAYAMLKENPNSVFPSGTTPDVSRTQLFRYERILKLIPPLLDQVDGETLPFQLGVELSFLSEADQELVNEFFFVRKEGRLSMRVVKRLRETADERPLTEEDLCEAVASAKSQRKPQGVIIPYDEILPYYGETPPEDDIICQFIMELIELFVKDESVKEAYHKCYSTTET
jgi:ParB family chromosome partitioning protein